MPINLVTICYSQRGVLLTKSHGHFDKFPSVEYYADLVDPDNTFAVSADTYVLVKYLPHEPTVTGCVWENVHWLLDLCRYGRTGIFDNWSVEVYQALLASEAYKRSDCRVPSTISDIERRNASLDDLANCVSNCTLDASVDELAACLSL
jgi:hypothetical protein